ncbi:hypothetical protein [Lysobacter sp. F6437]|uniref:hypothetical protein n=1 Tax=Lysobacter sp. F6437 TaxID=3459296 RepID=UPI00403D5A13
MSLSEELKKPYNLLSTAIGVFGILLGFWLYYISQERREPFYLAKESVQIFDSSAASPSIELTDKAGVTVRENVYVVETSIWNAGKRPIEPSDVRIPLTLNLAGAKRILDYGVVEQNQPMISEVSLSPVTGSKTALSISFKHLDPGLGARVKVVYAGQKDPEITLQGAIVGATIKDGTSVIYKYLPQWLSLFLSATVGWLLSGWSKTLAKRVPTDWPKGRRRFIKAAIFLGTIGVILLILRLLFGFTLPPV